MAIQKTSPLSGDFFLEVAKGNVAGSASFDKFGRNIEIETGAIADVWDGGHTIASGGVSLIWVAPTQARSHIIMSDSIDDTAGGGGARTVEIVGLLDWDTKEIFETITLDTANPPTTSNSYVIIHRMKVKTKGATSVNVGTITATAIIDNTITAQIQPGKGQTQMAIYGVPRSQTAFMGNLFSNVLKATGLITGNIALLSNPDPDVDPASFLVKNTFRVDYSHSYYVPKKFVGPAIIKAQVESGTRNMDISAGFDLILVDNK